MKGLFFLFLVSIVIASCGLNVEAKPKTPTETLTLSSTGNDSTTIISNRSFRSTYGNNDHYYTINITKFTDGRDTFLAVTNSEGGIYVTKR